MNTIKFIIVVSIALLSTDLVYHQVVNGQDWFSQENKEGLREYLLHHCAYFDERVWITENSTLYLKIKAGLNALGVSDLTDHLVACTEAGAMD